MLDSDTDLDEECRRRLFRPCRFSRRLVLEAVTEFTSSRPSLLKSDGDSSSDGLNEESEVEEYESNDAELDPCLKLWDRSTRCRAVPR